MDWKGSFPDELAGKGPSQLQPQDLMRLDYGKVMAAIDGNEGRYGFISKMAECRLGAPHASGYPERMNALGKYLMSEGRTLIGDEELEMLVVLRMNRKFMEYMKKKYPKVGLPPPTEDGGTKRPATAAASVPVQKKLHGMFTAVASPPVMQTPPASSAASASSMSLPKVQWQHRDWLRW